MKKITLLLLVCLPIFACLKQTSPERAKANVSFYTDNTIAPNTKIYVYIDNQLAGEITTLMNHTPVCGEAGTLTLSLSTDEAHTYYALSDTVGGDWLYWATPSSPWVLSLSSPCTNPVYLHR